MSVIHHYFLLWNLQAAARDREFPPGTFKHAYELGQQLGSGASGTVFECTQRVRGGGALGVVCAITSCLWLGLMYCFVGGQSLYLYWTM
jgi:hypothetical protein